MADISPTLFTPFRLGPYVLKNRIVALPVFSGYAGTDGRVTRLLLKHYAGLAASGAAIVIVANAAVSADGKTSVHNLRADHDDFIPGLARLAGAIRQNGALACLQLNHAGQYARTDRPRLCAPPQSRHLRFKVAAFKELMEFFPFEERYNLTRRFLRQANTWRQAMTAAGQAEVLAEFCQAADRARRAGFDMVELHGANGYLICQFLSAFTNTPQSNLNEEQDRRCAFPLSLVRAVKQHLPAGFPVGFRLMLTEWVPEGIDPQQAMAFAARLAAAEIDYLSPSAGTFNSIFKPEIRARMDQPLYLRQPIAELTRRIRVPTIASGRIRTPEQAARLLGDHSADLIGLGRALRADPEWVRKARRQGKKVRACANCLACLRGVVQEKGFVCRRWPKTVRRRINLEHKLLRRNFRMLVVAPDSDAMLWAGPAMERLWPVTNPFAEPVDVTFLTPVPEAQGTDDLAARLTLPVNLTRSTDRRPHSRTLPLSGPTPDAQAIGQIITAGNYGMILMARDPSQRWQVRLLFRLRQRVLALLGTHPRQDRVLIPVDLSDTTLLILTFLNHVVLPKADNAVQVIHFSNEPAEKSQRHWRQMKKICAMPDIELPLEIIKPEHPLAEEILELARRRDCGTVLMGKRGLSGLKRMVLGSVSARVLNGLAGQSLILVD